MLIGLLSVTGHCTADDDSFKGEDFDSYWTGLRILGYESNNSWQCASFCEKLKSLGRMSDCYCKDPKSRGIFILNRLLNYGFEVSSYPLNKYLADRSTIFAAF